MKRKMFKGMVSLMLSVVMVTGTVQEAFAEEVQHVETSVYGISAADAEKSPALTSGITKTASLETAEGENWYQFKVNKTGYFRVTLAPNANADTEDFGRGWAFCIYKKGDLTNAVKEYSGIKAACTSAYLPFEPGIYYIKVKADWSYEAPVNVPYDIRVDMTENSYWESEYNDTKAVSEKIEVNKTYMGTMHSDSDEDWYKFTTPAAGYYRVNLMIDAVSDLDDIHRGWKVTVYDSNGGQINQYSNINTSVTEPVMPFRKGTYYIKVASEWYMEAPVDVVYDLKVSYTKTTAWEQEDNDSAERASSISLNKTNYGNLYYDSDEDWYKVKVASKGVVKLTFDKAKDVDIDSLGRGWNICLYNADNNQELVNLKNIKSLASQSVTLKKGTYYIKVTAGWSHEAPVNCGYILKTAYAKTPAAPKVAVKAGKKQVKISWKKVSGATGYVVYRSTSKNGKYTKAATISKGKTVSYTDKKVKSKKTYYYKVSAYTKANGVTATSSQSAAKKVTVK